MNKEQFIENLEKLGIILSEEQLEKFELFYELLIQWNKKINLTTIIEKKDVYLKHFFDSLTLIRVIDLKQNLTLCDVGSGAGFPGIVLKIVFPNLNITLLDSLQKRVLYLNEIINELGLVNIRAVHFRMEDFSRFNEEKFDIITARAVAKLSFLAEISVKALKIGGKLVFMKANCEDELVEFNKISAFLGLTINSVDKFQLPIENSNRCLVTISKIKATDKKIPRDINKIRKKSL